MSLSANIIRELRTYFLSLDRKNIMSDDLKPSVDDTLRLGSPTKKFHAIYANRVIADEYEGIIGGGGGGSIDHANTVGVDYLTATEAAIDGNLYPLGSGAVFPSTVLPADVAYQNTIPTFTSINVTNYVDGIAVGAHTHSGSANMGVQVSHADLLNLSADHHTIYTRWDDTETVIKKWKFSNLAEENQDFNEYVGWEVEASVAMEDDGGWVPIMETAQAVLQSLSFTDPTYGHSYPLRIISHALYSSIQLGASGELELRYDSSDISATVGNIILSNTDGITVGSTFEVTQAGVLTATSGYIGTWEILDDKLQSTSGDAVLDSDGYIILKGSSIETRISSIHADYRLWIGGSGESTWDATTAKFIVNTAGQVTAETVAIKGLIHNYGSDKWKITSDGHAEFESIKCRGRLDTLVFTKSTVSTISGVLSLTNAGVLSENMTDAQTYLYLDAPEFGFGDIVLLQPSADNMEWMLIISTYTQMVIQNADGEDITVYKYTVSRDYGDYGTSYSFEKGVSVNGRGSYSVGNDPLPLASGDAQGVFGDYQPSGTFTGAGGGWLSLDRESAHITVNVRTGPLPEQYQQFIRIGNLQGTLDYVDVEWGFFVGDENNYFTYDQTDGLTIYSRDGYTTLTNLTLGNASAQDIPLIFDDGTDRKIYWDYSAVEFRTDQDFKFDKHVAFGLSGSVNENYIMYAYENYGDSLTASKVAIRGYERITLQATSGYAVTGIYGRGEINQNSYNLTYSRGVTGVYGLAFVSGSSGIVTGITGVSTYVSNAGAGELINAYGVYIRSGVNSGGGILSNLYGLKIENQTVGSSSNYAIYTGTGLVRFGGALSVDSGAQNAVAQFASTDPNAFVYLKDDTTNDAYVRVGAHGDDLELWAGNVDVVHIASGGAVYVTGWLVQIEHASPAIYIKETDAADPADTWRIVGTGSNLAIIHRDDSAAVTNTRMTMTPAGWINFAQFADNQGLKLFGFDDKSTSSLGLFLNSAGSSIIQASNIMVLQSLNAGYLHIHSDQNIYMDLGDDAGAHSLLLRDSGNANLFSINSDAKVTNHFATEDVEWIDAGSADATAQDWIEVEVGGVQGWVRVYPTK